MFPNCKAALAASVVLASVAAPRAEAVLVDNEIVLLVDAQAIGADDFNLILENVAQSFEQQSFIDGVAEGANGSIAATLVLFNSNNGETIGIPWMQLSSSSDLLNFADSVRNVTNATPFGNTSYAGAISTGAAQIANSIYEGSIGQLTVIDDGTGFFEVDEAGTQAARDAALASSVDVINAVVFDAEFQEDRIEGYYSANVVGGQGGTVTAVASPLVSLDGGLLGGPTLGRTAEAEAAIADSIASAVTSPTVDAAALSNVPEPSSVLLLLGSGIGFLVRRKR